MARLPHHEKCSVSEYKLTHYLLALDHPDGGPKAKFLARFGFTVETTEALRLALIDHAERNDVIDSRPTEFGTTFAIEGPIETPDGRNPVVRVVWMIDTGADTPRLITLVPGTR